MEWIMALLVLSNLYFVWRWRMAELNVEGFAFYIVKKGYTPPTKDEWRECIQSCIREKVKK